jgi:tetratricopeptide (TPR) repeat protein
MERTMGRNPQATRLTVLSTMFLSGLGALTLMADTDRGVELYRQGKFNDAQSELTKVLQDSPDDARAQRYLGLALVEQHKPSDAQPHLNKANELDPSDDTKLALARLYVEQKDLDKADAMLSDVDGSDRDYVRGLLQLQRQQNKESAASLESYLQRNPDNAYAHYYAGLAYNAAKRPDKMLTHFELFLKLRPDAPEAKKVRAVLSTGH